MNNEEKRNFLEMLELRPYQIKSNEEICLRFQRNPEIPLLLVLPTATGKTITALSICLRMIIEKNIKNTVWIAHRDELIDQAVEDCKEMLEKSKNNGIIGYFSNENDKIAVYNENSCYVGSFMFIKPSRAQYMNHEDINQETLVVFDEAHHYVSWNKTLNPVIFRQRNAKVLGLTATPFRMDTNDNNKTPFIWDFSKPIHEYNKDENEEDFDYEKLLYRINHCKVECLTFPLAIKQRYLSQYKIYDGYKKSMKKDMEKEGANSNNCLIETIINIIKENKTDINYDYPSERPKNGKILVFCRKEAEDLYNELIKNDIPTGILLSTKIDCKYKNEDGQVSSLSCSDDEKRKKIIQLFSNNDDGTNDKYKYEEEDEDDKYIKGHIKVLINNQILTEGFDENKVTDIIIAYNTNSFIKMTQILGRGIRLFKNEQQDFGRGCAIYNLTDDNIERKFYKGEDRPIGVFDFISFDAKHEFNDDPMSIVKTYEKSYLQDCVNGIRHINEFEIEGDLICESLFKFMISSNEKKTIEEAVKNNEGTINVSIDFSEKIGRRIPDLFSSMLNKNIAEYYNRQKKTGTSDFFTFLESVGCYGEIDNEPYDENLEEIDVNKGHRKDIERFCSFVDEKIEKMKKELESSDGQKSIKDVVRKVLENYDDIDDKDNIEDLNFYCEELLMDIITEGK